MGVKLGEDESKAQFRRILADPLHLLAVAQLEQDLSGYAWAQNYGPHLRAGFATARLHDLFVHKAHRKRGVGKGLLEHVKNWAKGEGITYLQWQANHRSTGFYEALGLEAISDPDPEHPFFEVEFD